MMSALPPSRPAYVMEVEQNPPTRQQTGDTVNAAAETVQIIVIFPCKDVPGTIEIMRRYLNIRLVEGLRISQAGHPYHVPFSFSREEATRFAQDLNKVGTSSQIVPSP